MTSVRSWPAPTVSTGVRASVSVPGSKSLTNRYLIIAALASDESVLRGVLDSRDTRLMMGALEALGARFEHIGENELVVTPIAKPPAPDPAYSPTASAHAPSTPPVQVDCGLAGTVMRFVPPVAAVTGQTAHFDGDPQARVRPMSTVADALSQLGFTVSTDNGFLPLTLRPTGAVRGGHVDIDASASSQFVSGLLLSGSGFDLGLEITHTGKALPSRPHIDMTVQTLADAGVNVSEPDPGRWVVEPGAPRGLDVTVEPDLSNAATFGAAALVTGGHIEIPRWPAATTQAGDEFRRIAQAFGALVSLSKSGLTVQGPHTLQPVDLDLSAVGELTPVVAAVAALAPGTSHLTGIGHLRGHETDRLSALATELSKTGAQVIEGPDYLTITSLAQHGCQWETYADHRMVMAGAIIGLRIPGIDIIDPGTVAKTMPQFTTLWDEMVRAQ